MALTTSQVKNRISYHQSRAQASKFVSEHIQDGEQYSLNVYDLVVLGLIDSPFDGGNNGFNPDQWSGFQRFLSGETRT